MCIVWFFVGLGDEISLQCHLMVFLVLFLINSVL